jgi:hypothetical protein
MADEEKQEQEQEQEQAAPKAPPPVKPAPLPDLGPGEGILGITVDMAKSMLVVGIVLVLLSRGCDSLARRSVAAAQAKLQLVQADFSNDWEDDEIDLKQDIRDIQNDITKEREAEKRDDDAIKKLEERLKKKQEDKTKFDKERAEATQEFQEGDLRDYQYAATCAKARSEKGGWWREAFFVLGTLLVTLAVSSIGFQSTGPERIVSLIILAIIVFSIYIGGIAWLSSAAAVVR